MVLLLVSLKKKTSLIVSQTLLHVFLVESVS